MESPAEVTLPALMSGSFLPDQAHQAPEEQAGQTRGKAQGIRATVPRSPEAGEGKAACRESCPFPEATPGRTLDLPGPQWADTWSGDQRVV